MMLAAISMNKFKWLTLRNTALYICFAVMKRAPWTRLKALAGRSLKTPALVKCDWWEQIRLSRVVLNCRPFALHCHSCLLVWERAQEQHLIG